MSLVVICSEIVNVDGEWRVVGSVVGRFDSSVVSLAGGVVCETSAAVFAKGSVVVAVLLGKGLGLLLVMVLVGTSLECKVSTVTVIGDGGTLVPMPCEFSKEPECSVLASLD